MQRGPSRYDVSFAPVGARATIRVRGGMGRVDLDLKQQIAAAPADDAYTIWVIQYSYRVVEDNGRELLAFHWHPDGVSPIKHPHLHLSSRIAPIALGSGAASVALGELHIPTGFVALGDVVHLLIEELGVEPRRADWRAVLEAVSERRRRLTSLAMPRFGSVRRGLARRLR